METIKLYRGDSTRISRFTVAKSADNCLYGKGIYLTEDPSVAQTYLSKDQKRITIPFKKHKKHAEFVQNGRTEYLVDFYLKQIMDAFILHLWQVFDDKQSTTYDAFYEKNLSRARSIVDRTIVRYHVRRKFNYLNPDEFNATIQLNQTYHLSQLSVFEFNKEQLLSSMLDISRPITDIRVLKILFDRPGLKHGLGSLFFKNSSISFKDFCSLMKHRFPCQAYNKQTFKEIYNGLFQKYLDSGIKHPGFHINIVAPDLLFDFKDPVLINKLKFLGYKGYLYGGGVITSSDMHHNAYSIWDERFVNQHRTGKINSSHLVLS